MKRHTLLAALPILGLLLGCELAQPFSGPGFEGGEVTAQGSGVLVAAATHLIISEDPGSREAFDEQMAAVLPDLDSRAGLVGYSLRQQIPGREVWTVSVWESEDAMLGYVLGETHLAAMDAGAGFSEAGRTVMFEIERDDMPPQWDDVDKRLVDDGRDAY